MAAASVQTQQCSIKKCLETIGKKTSHDADRINKWSHVEFFLLVYWIPVAVQGYAPTPQKQEEENYAIKREDLLLIMRQIIITERPIFFTNYPLISLQTCVK